MAHLSSLPEPAHLSDLFQLYPQNVDHLMRFTDGLLRGEGALSIGERELIATYVSGLNACKFCHDSHLIYARLFGIDPGVVESILENIDTAKVDEAMKPLLRYIEKLNFLPSRIVKADAQAVYAAGWSDEALFEAIKVCGLFNMMNRIVEGAGVNFDYDTNPDNHPAYTGGREAQAHSYLGFGKRLGVMEENT